MYQDIEPIPEVPNYSSTLPAVFISYGVGGVGSCLTIWLAHSPLGFAFYAPLIFCVAWSIVSTVRRSRKFRRDLDAWQDRMIAHYARPFEQRRKAMWS